MNLNDIDALSDYIREYIQVIAAHTEECQESAGVCISIVAPPFIQFFDSIHNRVDVVMDIEKQPKPDVGARRLIGADPTQAAVQPRVFTQGCTVAGALA